MSDATAAKTPRTRAIITVDTRPMVPKHIKFRHDPERNRWIILAPERVFDPDETAIAVFKLIDGIRTVDAIIEMLAKDYNAPKENIMSDVIAMLQDLADKGVITA